MRKEKEQTRKATRNIVQFAKKKGAGLVGVADLKLLKGIKTYPSSLLDGFSRGISVGVRLNDVLCDEILALRDRPTLLYTQNNVIANGILNTITFHLANYITDLGYRAVPIIASQAQIMAEDIGNISPDEIDWGPFTSSSVPAKAVGSAAGLGWIGKNILLINPEIGPRFRLATVLTDMPLVPSTPMESRCVDCEECVKACPVGAIRGLKFSGIPPPPREEILDFPKCRNRLWLENRSLPSIGYPVCGICLAACPFGRKGVR